MLLTSTCQGVQDLEQSSKNPFCTSTPDSPFGFVSKIELVASMTLLATENRLGYFVPYNARNVSSVDYRKRLAQEAL